MGQFSKLLESRTPNRVDIIIPVYNGFRALKQCVHSVLNFKQDVPSEIVFVNDASTDFRVQAFLEKIGKKYPFIHVLQNRKNLGFVASSNLGISIHSDRDIVLLNSDTIVSGNWLDRMVKAAYRSQTVGTVTPFSNNATICSFPGFCRENSLPATWTVDFLNAVFSEVNKNKFVDIPTGVGFCMYIKRACLEDVGLFDEFRFGRGYGEENDFCMRASKKGWSHRLAGDVFVYHAGGMSFGKGRRKLLKSAMETLDRLHPTYHANVRRHIALDPAMPYRINAYIEILRRSKRPKVLFVTHHLGGGTEKHVRELASYLRNKIDVVVLRPGHNSRITMSLSMEMSPGHLTFKIPDDFGDLEKIITAIDISRIHIHHLLGFKRSFADFLLELRIPIDLTLHDYFLINGNPNLTDKNGTFIQGLLDGDNKTELAVKYSSLPIGLNMTEWQVQNQSLMLAADRIISPTVFTKQLFRFFYPDVSPIVAYHPDWEQNPRYSDVELAPLDANESLKVLVIGVLNRAKGVQILEKCAKRSRKNRAPLKYHFLGYANKNLDKSIVRHGAYDDADLGDLIDSINPHLVWFPAQWPETYSYTLSAALRAGKPIVAPDIGAYPERLHGRPFTWIEPWDRKADAWADFFFERREEFLNIHSNIRQQQWINQPVPPPPTFLYGRDYVIQCKSKTYPVSDSIEFGLIESHLAASNSDAIDNSQSTKKEYFLALMYRIYSKKWVANLLRCIPFRLQRAVIRRLRHRSIPQLISTKDV